MVLRLPVMHFITIPSMIFLAVYLTPDKVAKVTFSQIALIIRSHFVSLVPYQLHKLGIR